MNRFLLFQSSDTSTMSIEVKSLSPYTTYQLRLIAQNVVGRCAPSSPTRGFTTLKEVPEVAPQNVTVIALNATALMISWLVSLNIECFSSYSETCLFKATTLKQTKKFLKTAGSLVQVESIAECFIGLLTCIRRTLVLKSKFWVLL